MVIVDVVFGWVFGGGVYKKWLWGILWCWISGILVNEVSVVVNVGYKISKSLIVSVKLEYLGVMMYVGFMVGSYRFMFGFKAFYLDRSYLMIIFSVKF